MNKTKMTFMREAPTFVFALALALFALVFIAGARLLVCGDLFGLYLIGLILAGVATIAYAIRVFSRGLDESFFQVWQKHREYWGKNDK